AGGGRPECRGEEPRGCRLSSEGTLGGPFGETRLAGRRGREGLGVREHHPPLPAVGKGGRCPNAGRSGTGRRRLAADLSKPSGGPTEAPGSRGLMLEVVILDTHPLALVCQRRGKPEQDPVADRASNDGRRRHRAAPLPGAAALRWRYRVQFWTVRPST